MNIPESSLHVFVCANLLRHVRIYAAATGLKLREITEKALEEWLDRNPLPDDIVPPSETSGHNGPKGQVI